MAKQKNRSETQNFINKTNPQGEVPAEEIKAHLEKKIVDQVKQLAQGFTVSVYALIELGKELVAIEDQIEKAANPPEETEVKKEDF